MRPRVLVAALASMLPLIATAAADEDDDDIKCLAVSLRMSSSQDADAQSIGMLSTMYWMGKLDGHSPKLDVESRAMAAMAAMTPSDFQTEAARCADALKARGDALTKMDQDMQQQQQQQDNAR